jgi:hypothetical protein
MRSLMLTTVAAAALALAAPASLAQTSGGTLNQSGSSAGASGAAESPGRSGTAPGQNRVDGGSGGPGRSESAPGQSRVDGGAGAPGRSESAPDRSRVGSSSAQERDQRQPSGSAGSTDRTGSGPRDEQRRSSGAASSSEGGSSDRTGAASTTERNRQDSSTSASQPDRSRSEQNQQERAGSASRDSTSDRTSSDRGDPRSTGAISGDSKISEQDRTRITQSFTQRDVRPVTNVNFSISVGTSVPDRVDLHEVPSDVVQVVPQYRGYRYFVVRDEIVIVEPRSKRIVEVIRREGGSRSATSTSITLSSDQRATFRRVVRERGPSRVTTRVTLREGATLPDDIDLLEVPDTIVTDIPEVREYRYVMIGEDIALVEPRTRRVIEVID